MKTERTLILQIHNDRKIDKFSITVQTTDMVVLMSTVSGYFDLLFWVDATKEYQLQIYNHNTKEFNLYDIEANYKSECGNHAMVIAL